MKNDIIGTFGVLILGVLFLFFAQNYNDGEYWVYDLGSLSTMMGEVRYDDSSPSADATNTAEVASPIVENERPVVAQVTYDPLPDNGIIEVDIKPDKNGPALPYLSQQLQKEYSKTGDMYLTVGENFSWPAKNNNDSVKMIAGAKGVVLEQKYDPNNRNVTAIRNFITGRLKKMGYKKVNFKNPTCQVSNLGTMSVCLDYYERGEKEKCLSVQVMSPYDQRDSVKIKDQIVQIKVLCGGG